MSSSWIKGIQWLPVRLSLSKEALSDAELWIGLMAESLKRDDKMWPDSTESFGEICTLFYLELLSIYIYTAVYL